MKRLAISIILAVLNCQASAAPEGTGPRYLVDVGCHNTDGVCFFTTDGNAFGAAQGCPVGATTEIRIDNGDTSIGRKTYASLLAAFLARKQVQLVISGCTNQGFSALQYFHIIN